MANEQLNNETQNLIEAESLADNEIVVQPVPGSVPSPTLENISWKNALPQIAACCIVHTIIIQTGINMAFSAILLPQLNETTSDIHITISQGSWIASLVTISLPVGSLFVGFLVDKVGRRNTCIFTTLPFIISWLLMANAKNVWHIYCARVLAGFSGGLATACLIYVSEITHPSFRPMLLGLNSVFVSLGILLTCLFGYWLHWRTISYINCSLIVIPLAFLFGIPESPHWLIVFKDDLRGTAKSLRWLYKDEHIYETHIQNFLQARSNSTITNNDHNDYSKWVRLKQEMKIYLQPIVYKPITILCMIFLFQQLSGAYVIIFYAVQLFSKLDNNSGIDPNVAFVLLGVIRFVMAIISAFVSKRFGRRPLLIISGLGMCIFILIAGIIVVPINVKVLMTFNNNKIVIYCILGYICSSSLAYLVIPWTLIGELLPVKVRGNLGGFIVGIAYLFMFGTVKAFPFIMEAFNVSYIFYFFCIINFGGVSYIYIFLPETLGKSFAEIERHFQPSL